jgi:hypothetical protein
MHSGPGEHFAFTLLQFIYKLRFVYKETRKIMKYLAYGLGCIALWSVFWVDRNFIGIALLIWSLLFRNTVLAKYSLPESSGKILPIKQIIVLAVGLTILQGFAILFVRASDPADPGIWHFQMSLDLEYVGMLIAVLIFMLWSIIIIVRSIIRWFATLYGWSEMQESAITTSAALGSCVAVFFVVLATLIIHQFAVPYVVGCGLCILASVWLGVVNIRTEDLNCAMAIRVLAVLFVSLMALAVAMDLFKLPEMVKLSVAIAEIAACLYLQTLLKKTAFIL